MASKKYKFAKEVARKYVERYGTEDMTGAERAEYKNRLSESNNVPSLIDAANRYLANTSKTVPSDQGFTAAMLTANRVNEGEDLHKRLYRAAATASAPNKSVLTKAAQAVNSSKELQKLSTQGRYNKYIQDNNLEGRLWTDIQKADRDALQENARLQAVNTGKSLGIMPQADSANIASNRATQRALSSWLSENKPRYDASFVGGRANADRGFIAEYEAKQAQLKELDDLLSKQDYYEQNTAKYGSLGGNADFKQKVRTGRESSPTINDYYTYYNDPTDTAEFSDADFMALYLSVQGTEDEQYAKDIDEFYPRWSDIQYMTDEQRDTFFYIKQTEGDAAAQKYVSDIYPTLLRAGRSAQEQKAIADAQTNPVASSVQSALLAPLAGFNYITRVGTNLTGGGRDALGSRLDAAWTPADQRFTQREAVTQGIKSPVGQFFYGTGMSMADNLVNRAAGLGNGGISLFLMSTGAATQSYNEAIKNGRTEDEALAQATAAGAIEFLTEKAGFDNLTDIIKAGKTSWRSAFINMAKQGVIEATEEGASNLANLTYDIVAYGGDSEVSRRVDAYVNQGMTEAEARQKVIIELVGEFGTDVAGGALSGALFGAGGSFASTVANADAVYTEDRGAQLRLVEAARAAGSKQADKYARQIMGGKALSKEQFANAYDAVDVAQQKEAEGETPIRNKYTKDKDTQAALVAEGLEVGSQRAAEYAKILDDGKTLNRQQYANLVKENDTKIAEIEARERAEKDDKDARERAEKTAKAAGEKTAEPIRIAQNITQEQRKMLDEMADTYADSKTTFIRGYQPTVNGKSVSVQEYTSAVNSVVQAFANGEKANPSAYDALGTEGMRAARSIAVRRSINDTMQQAEDAAAKIQEKLNKVREGYTGEIKPGKVTYTSEAAQNRTGTANAALFIAHSKAYGTNFEIHETLEKENGYYDPKTNTIHLAADAEDPLIMVAAHELTHYIEKWSPEKYQKLVKLLKNYYGGEWNGLVDAKMQSYSAAGISLSINGAVDEVVADACQLFFGMDADSQEYADLVETIAKEDVSLARKIVDFLEEIYEAIKELLISLNPRSAEAQILSENKKMLEKARALWTQALGDASVTSAAVNAREQEVLAANGISYDEDTQSVHSIRHSFATKDEIKGVNIDGLAEIIAKATDRSLEDAKKWIQSEMTVANAVLADPEFLDFEVDNRYEAIKKNSDYPQGTVDLSNLCPKRTEFTTMFDMIQKKYPNKMFTAQDVAEMRNILKDHDITVACGCCFVEDRRQLLGEIADTYIGMWKEAVETGKPLSKINAQGNKVQLNVTKALAKQYGLTAGEPIMATDTYIPTQYDLTTYEGFKILEKAHPEVAMGFVRYNNSRGQQAARLIEGRAEYDRQILGWSPRKVSSVNNNGGLRIFSFSDFEVVHLLDLVQVIIDCSAKGVKIQGYTKIPAFAKLVRNTGIKLNRSLIPKGATGLKYENGKWALEYDATEGIDINDENFLDERDNPNVGNIIIGINRQQIGVAMLDDFIDYIIPFHSNKSKDILQKSGVGEWENYKESQHEKDIETGKAAKKNVNIYTQVINKYKPKNKVEFVNAFLKECKAQGKIPRYSEFLNRDENGDFTYREGYHKLLIDFKMFDAQGNILPQGNIVPELDNDFMTEMLEAEVDRKKTYEFPDAVYNEIEEAFGGEIQRSIRDTEYLKAVEDGDMETAQKLVDEAAREAGFIQKAYHGTDSEDFYKFMWEETQRADAGWYGRGHYFATRKGEAEMYGKRVISAVLNLGKTFNFDKEMMTIDGHNGQNVSFNAVAFYINAAEKFPNIFKNRKISIYDYSTGERTIEWGDVRNEINKILDDPTFKTIQYTDGRYRWTLGDWKKKAYYSNDYYDTKADADSAKYAAAVDFWVEKNNVQVPMSPEGYYLGGDMNASNAFTEELKKQGYNSVIQSENGDEIVVFNSNQIKSADPVTYDNNGEVIPLSERFTDDEDIRYSVRASYVEPALHINDDAYPYTDWILDGKKQIETRWRPDFRDFVGKRVALLKTGKGKQAMVVGYATVAEEIEYDSVEAFRQDSNKHLVEAGSLYDITKSKDGKKYGYRLSDVERVVPFPAPKGSFKFGDFASRDLKVTDSEDIRYSVRRSAIDSGILAEAEGSTNDEKVRLKTYRNTLDEITKINNEIGEIAVQMEEATGEKLKNLAARNRKLENDLDVKKEDIARIRESKEIKAVLRTAKLSMWDESLAKYGMIEPGEQVGTEPNRDIQVPQKTSESRKTMRFARTVLESHIITDSMVDDVKEAIISEAMSYVPETNEAAMERARKLVDAKNQAMAWEMWQNAVYSKTAPSKDIIAIGEALLQQAAAAGDAASVVEITAQLAEIGTRAGQTVQALSMLKRMGPAAKLYFIQRTVANVNTQLAKRIGMVKKGTHVKIDENLAEQLISAKTEEEQKAAADAILTDIARQVPSTWIDKWNAWRYLSMLGNPRTHIRNIVGNAVFVPAVSLKNVIATGIEKVALRKSAPTKAIIVHKEYVDFAKQDFENVKDDIKGVGKYAQMSDIQDKRRIFKSKILEAARVGNFNLLEKEDGIFLKFHYQTAMSQYLQANKVDITNMSQTTLNNARLYAMNEAKKATYRDASAFAETLTNLGKSKNVAWRFIVESVVPFKQTPVNILRRGIEYSPVGLLTSVTKGVADLKSGKITAAQFIDGVAAGLTGTAVVAVGVLLGALGLVTGGLGSDEEDKFDKLTGQQAYALKIGNGSYTIDWAAPIAMPFFVGVELSNLARDKEGWTAADILNALTLITEPVFNLTMLDGVNSLLQGVSFADDKEKIAAAVGEMVSSYVMQSVPTLVGQIARSIDRNQRTSYTDKTKDVPKFVQSIAQSFMRKIPGLTRLLQPYINEWGEEVKSNDFERVAENLVSPGYFSKIEMNDVETELARLYEATGDGSILPDKAPKKIKSEDLTPEEYTAYAKLKGAGSLATLSDLFESEAYKALPDEQKVKAIEYAYKYANELAMRDIKGTEPNGAWVEEFEDMVLDGESNIGDLLADKANEYFESQEAKENKAIAIAMLESGKNKEVSKYIKGLKDDGTEEQYIWSSFSGYYRNEYKEAWRNGDKDRTSEIETMLESLGLKNKKGQPYADSDFFEGWREAAEESGD